MGNSVQKESLAFVAAEPPETFTEEQNKTKQTLELLWLIQFKFGSATRKCSRRNKTKPKENSKTLIEKEIHIMQNRRRGRSCLGESFGKVFFKQLLWALKTPTCFGCGDDRALAKVSEHSCHMVPVFNVTRAL